MKSAAHHDFVADYVKAVRSAGLGVGLYYSPLDWRFPGFFFPGVYRASAVEMRNQYARQIDQLASNYGKIDLLWFDGGGNEWLGFGGVEFTGSGWRARAKDQPYSGKFDWEDNRTVGHLRALQPSIVINDRTNAAADFRSREGDGALGNYDDKTPWELCTTITEGAWGYQPNAKVKSLESLIHLLVGAAGRDGNMLLNVGPRPDGQIEPQQVERLREIGSWLEQNGESIYGTRGGPWMPAKYGVTTHKDRAIYVHLLQKELPVSIHLPPLPVKVLSVTLLHGAPVAFHQSENGVEIQLAGVQASANDSILLLRTEQSWTGEAIKVADSE
jgi:alpha-L-fucosidase